MTAIQLRKKEVELELVREALKKKEQELRLREQASDKQVSAIAKAEQQRRSEHDQRGKELEHQTVLASKFKNALHETEASAAVAAFTNDSGLASPGAVLRQASLQSPPREAGTVHQRTPLFADQEMAGQGVAQGARLATVLLVAVTRRRFPRIYGRRRWPQHQL
jgi:hypothetical protein